MPSTSSRGDDLEGLDALPGVDQGLDSVTLHGAKQYSGGARSQRGTRRYRWMVATAVGDPGCSRRRPA